MSNLKDAQSKIAAIPTNTSSFDILNGMLNFALKRNYPNFIETQEIIAKDIMNSTDLNALAEYYDKNFLIPMRAVAENISRSDSIETDLITKTSTR